MFLLTMPDTPVTSARGIAHLLIVGLTIIVSLIGVIVLAIRGTVIPDVLSTVIAIGVGYLVGANVVNSGKA